MIEQIIEKVLKKYPFAVKYTSGDREIVDFDYHRKELGSLKIDLVLEFSSYNKQLLDGIAKEVNDLENPYDSLDQEWYDGVEQIRRDITTIINSKVTPPTINK